MVWLKEFIRTVFRHWQVLMSCAVITAIGLVSTYIKNTNSFVQVATYSAAGVGLIIATLLAYRDKYNELVNFKKESGTTLLALEEKLDKAINAQRPEVFVSYKSPTIFNETPRDSWNPDLTLCCPQAVSLTNSGGSVAFDVQVEAVGCKAFTIIFASLPKLDVGANEVIEAVLFPAMMTFGKGRLCLVNQPEETITLVYEGHEDESGKTAKIISGLCLKVHWRNSGGYYFFSTLRDGKWSPVQRMDVPVMEEDINDAYVDEEVTP